MLARFLPLILILPAIALSAPVRAGDAAPEVDWSKVVQSPPNLKFNPSLTGQYTVLQFLGPVTANGQAIERWNETIAALRVQPVQFIWVAREPWSKVEPFLKAHPVDGWLLIDESRQIARSWGFDESGGIAIIEPSGRIAGFTQFVGAAELSDLIAGKQVRLDPEPSRPPMPHLSTKPDLPPSLDVHISPSKTEGTESAAGEDYWVQRGFGLKEILAQVYETDPTRVELAEKLNDGRRFDFVAVLPQPDDMKKIDQLARKAIEQYFRVSLTLETKPAQVYLMTAIEGKTPPAKSKERSMGGASSWSSVSFSLPAGVKPTPEAIAKAMEEQQGNGSGIADLAAPDSDMESLSGVLQQALGIPVIDNTGLNGTYDIKVKSDSHSTEEFLEALREQMGIVLTRSTRPLELVTVRALN
jgi:uncharacterized protein (TIGR03435 family)